MISCLFQILIDILIMSLEEYLYKQKTTKVADFSIVSTLKELDWYCEGKMITSLEAHAMYLSLSLSFFFLLFSFYNVIFFILY